MERTCFKLYEQVKDKLQCNLNNCSMLEGLIVISLCVCLLGKQIGEEAVSLNPSCAESHQW